MSESARLIRSLLPVHPGELVPASLAASWGFLVIGSYLALKAARDSIFLTRLGPERLPLVTIGIALLVGLFVGGYLRASRRIPTGPLVAFSLLFFAGNLGLFSWALQAQASWLPWVFYVWVGCFGVIAPVQLWTVVNEVFTIRQAKRLLPLIGAGGILGAMMAGRGVGLAAERIGTSGLVAATAAVLAACSGLAILLARWSVSNRQQESSERTRTAGLHSSLRKITRSRHLALLAAIVWISGVATTLIDWQFKSVAVGALQGDSLTAFFGNVYGGMALASLVVQLGLVRFVLRQLGFRFAIGVLPLALLAGTVGFLLLGTLTAAVVMRFGDGAFKHSLDRSARELSYMHLPAGTRVRVKSAIDMVLDRLGDGSGGLVLLALIALGMGSVRTVGIASLLFVGGWLALTIGMARNYRGELERAVRVRGEPERWTAEALADPDVRRVLRSALLARERRTVLAALEIVAASDARNYARELAALARDEDAEIRDRALGLALRAADEALPAGISTKLEEGDRELLAGAFEVMLAPNAEAARARSLALLDGRGASAAAARLALLFRRLGDDLAPVARRIMDVLCSPASPPEARRALAASLAMTPGGPESVERIMVLLEDEDRPVRCEAILAAGALREPRLVAPLVRLLRDAQHDAEARDALLAIGDDAVPELAAALREEDGRTGDVLVPGVLGQVGTPRALAVLEEALDHQKTVVRAAVIEALVARQRRDPAMFSANVSRIWKALRLEVEHWEDLARLGDALAALGRDAEVDLLRESARESIARIRGRIFALLELRFGTARTRRLERQIKDGAPAARDAALELLDDLLPRRIATRLIPLVEDDGAAPRARPRLVESRPDLAALFLRLVDDDDPWIAACALGAASRLDDGAIARRLGRHALAAPSGLVRDQARRLASDDEPRGLSAVEQVLLLRSTRLFGNAETGELSHLAAAASERTFRPGETLIAARDAAAPLIALIEGRAGLRRAGRVRETYGPGAVLGVRAALGGSAVEADAVALQRVRALVIGHDAFSAVLGRRPQLARAVMVTLATGMAEHLPAEGANDGLDTGDADGDRSRGAGGLGDTMPFG